jgi:magnesium transporter
VVSPPGPTAEIPDVPSPAGATPAGVSPAAASAAGLSASDAALAHADLVHGRPGEPGTTFLGRDPRGVAAQSIAHDTPTACQARTRLYQGGQLTREGFPVAQISDFLADESAVVWLDLHNPRHEDLAVLSGEFGLHPLAVEDAIQYHERTKLDRYHSHLFLLAYGVKLDAGTGELVTSELAAFITRQALITVRKDDGLDIGVVLDYWDQSPDLAGAGVSYLLHGVLDYLVDSHFATVQAMDSSIEDLEDELFDEGSRGQEVQRRSFELRKSLVMLRRVVLPMREVVNTLMRRDLHVVTDEMHPYYQDVYDHVLRATEWTESLRDLVTTILEANLTIQGNRMNVITKKVTSWAAIIAVPTFVTGFYGMNVPYPGFGKSSGVLTALALMIVIAGILYVVFKKRDWL